MLCGFIGVALLLCGPLVATPSAEHITVSATGRVFVAADSANVALVLTLLGNSREEAEQEMQHRRQQFYASLQELGVEVGQVEDRSFSVTPARPLDRRTKWARRTRFRAFQVFIVSLTRPALVDEVGFLAIRLGASPKDGVEAQFVVTDTHAARRQAFDLAYAKAQADAQSVAKARGLILGDLTRVEASDDLIGKWQIWDVNSPDFAKVDPYKIVVWVRVVLHWSAIAGSDPPN
jgi:uncharacterized protein YggE